MLKLLKVSGDSLSPAFQEGDFVVIAKIPLFFNHPPKPGDVIVFNHAVFGTMIKLVESVILEKEELFVVGTHQNSIDSRRFGPIPIRSVIGKVIWHIKRPRSK